MQNPNFANYPRPGYQTTPFGRPPGVYLDAIGDALNLVKQDLGTWVAAALIFFLIAAPLSFASTLILGSGSFAAARGNTPLNLAELFTQSVSANVLGIFFSAVAQVLLAGMCRMGTQVARGFPIGLGDMFFGFRRFGIVYSACLICAFSTLIGFFLCFVPGIYLTGALVLVPLVAVDQDVSIAEALSRGYEALKSGAWAMTGVLFVVGLLVGAGVLCCGIGVLFTFPVYCAVVGLHYHYFFPSTAAPAVDYVPPGD